MRSLSTYSIRGVLSLLFALPIAAWAAESKGGFTLLEQLPAPKIVKSAEAYPGGRHEVSNLLDGNPATEYSSNNKGTNTFVEFDFGRPVEIAAFRHQDRNDPAIIAGSELQVLDAAGQVTATVPIPHVRQRAGVTFLTLTTPITAQHVVWRVTTLGANHGTVGGAELAFFKAGRSEAKPFALVATCKPQQMVERQAGREFQPIKITLNYPYARNAQAVVRLEGAEPKAVQLRPGTQTVEVAVPAVERDQTLALNVEIGGERVVTRTIKLAPARHYQIYILPHSHNDIGYTALQADVVKKQDSNIETGLRLAKETANYPEGSRFKWNVEVLWCVDNYLRDADPRKRAEFLQAVRAGQIGLDAFYCNILTGLCRPEELLNLMSYATRLSDLCGVPVESAMISDVPGYTWSTVSAMAEAGVKYFSFAPNYFDRMGGTMKEWQNKPFWWKGPDGKQRVLCWCPSRGYALGHLIGDGENLARFMPSYLEELETNAYPYEISHLRWNVHGDNGSPDEKVADVVKDWNTRYAWPRLIIATTAEAFREFERRYGDKLPQYSGDYTPYWEDGAASSARETALNRASAERLTQAETLWSLRHPGPFPAAEFQKAWKNVLLYSEHTWGAHNSISQPDLPFVLDQWKVKQAFALDADRQSRDLLRRAGGHPEGGEERLEALEVWNTSSWRRTDLATLTARESGAGDRVVDEAGKAAPSQRLSTGELVFLAREVPPFGCKRFRIQSGPCPIASEARAAGNTLSSSDFTVKIDDRKGGITSLYSRSLKQELVDSKAATALNDFFYLPGADLKNLERNGTPRISVKEKGPLVASLVVTSEAPGCRKLVREVQVVDGLDRVELINLVDKLPMRAKEAVHFGYGFNVPRGTVRVDVGWASVRPEVDQIPASCKNWFSAQRWVDISNDRFGVTWAPVDAPLVELGSITANLIGSQTDWRVWIQHLQPTQTLYSWVMNNHWHTNYRAEQDGPTVFRFFIRPHKKFAADEAARFGTDCSQPLIVAATAGGSPAPPRVLLSSEDVLVASLKPSDDGKATIVRLFGASGKTRNVSLTWSEPRPQKVWRSDTSEKAHAEVKGAVEVPGWGIVTLRAEP